MPPSAEAVALAAQARDRGVVAVLTGPAEGMAAPAIVWARGPDAASFLHSQVTNDVEGLAEGAGNLNARVTRTGHLQHLFSLHRAEGEAFLLLTEAAWAERLRDDLDAFLFTDDLTLEVDDSHHWIAVQGPNAAEACEAVFGPLGFEPWATLPEHGVRALRRAKRSAGVELPPGCFALRRSFTGDVGYLLAFPAGHPCIAALRTAFGTTVCVVTGHQAYAAALEVLRVETGAPRMGPETDAKKRLLPEMGIEQSAVSYTKGCYLGQEVIARVRTYGSVPNLLRGLLLEGSGQYDDAARAALAALPPLGAPLKDPAGKTIGHLMSRTWSPVMGAPVALAFLGRNHRTPGRALSLHTDTGSFTATVQLLPFFSAPDTASRVAFLYDKAIRTFADGREDDALTLLEEALRIDPSHADAYEAIGVILGRAGRYHEAIDVFRRLEEVAPQAPMVNTNLSLYYMKLGDRETAENEAAKATTKGMAKLRGKEKTAAEFEDDVARSRTKDALRKRNMFSRVLEIDEVDPIALFGMGNALLVLGEAAEAEASLRRALEVDSKNSAVYVAHGKALERLERVDDAIATYRDGVEVASRKGDLMPLREMEHRLLLLGASRNPE